ncbi:MAG: aminotransferase class I/II-fold pyridoxal phosphate-dependent enzyme [Candidatus Magasanikbacteria bacterium]
MPFQKLNYLEPDPIFALNQEFQLDQNPDKINLGIGVITNDQSKTYAFESLQNIIIPKNNDYLPILGDKFFKKNFEDFFLDFTDKDNITSVQTAGGTHANFLASKLFQKMGFKKIYFPNYTWVNHHGIFEEAGLKIGELNYYDAKKQKLKENFLNSIEKIADNSLLSLDACGHNPTGVDLNSAEITEIIKIAKKKNLFFFIDAAYVGLVNETIEKDLELVKRLYEAKITFALAFSFSKNMSLYGHRLGVLTLLNIKNDKTKIESNLAKIIRSNISNAPRYSSDLATQILGDKIISKKWQEELNQIKNNMSEMRRQLVCKLNSYKINIANEITNQKGLFSLLPNLDTEKLKKDYAIYIPKNGRINISSIKPNNLDRLAEAISKSLI